jgi:fumarate reductase subunit D
MQRNRIIRLLAILAILTLHHVAHRLHHVGTPLSLPAVQGVYEASGLQSCTYNKSSRH